MQTSTNMVRYSGGKWYSGQMQKPLEGKTGRIKRLICIIYQPYHQASNGRQTFLSPMQPISSYYNKGRSQNQLTKTKTNKQTKKLARQLNWLEHHPINQKFVNLIPGRVHTQVVSSIPSRGKYGRQLIDVFLSQLLSLSHQ